MPQNRLGSFVAYQWTGEVLVANAQRIDPREARKEKQTDLVAESLPSIAAGISWMFGVVSIPLLLAPPSSLVTGLLAIVFGHVAKYRIRKRQELAGEGVATSGLLMGYLCFLAAIALLPSIRMQSTVSKGIYNSIRGVTAGKPGTAFEKAERSFLSGSSLASGNTKDARELSNELSAELNEKREEFFRGRNPLKIRTVCQISEAGLCVIVLISDLSEFDQLARDAMLNLVWKRSQSLAFGKITPGEDVAVVVRDRLRYHSMEFGRGTKSPDRIAQPDSSFIDTTMLEPHFEPTKETAESEEQRDE